MTSQFWAAALPQLIRRHRPWKSASLRPTPPRARLGDGESETSFEITSAYDSISALLYASVYASLCLDFESSTFAPSPAPRPSHHYTRLADTVASACFPGIHDGP